MTMLDRRFNFESKRYVARAWGGGEVGNYVVRLPEASARKSVDRFIKARENYPTKEVKWDNSGQRFVRFQLIILTLKDQDIATRKFSVLPFTVLQ